MSSDSRGGTSRGVDDALINDMSNIPLEQNMSNSSESGSSYIGSGMPSPPAATVCEWRTDRFHDQECERFFDCPTHIVERSLSEHGHERHEPDEASVSSIDDDGGEGPSNSGGGIGSNERDTPVHTSDEPPVAAPKSSESIQETTASSSRDDITDVSHERDSTREVSSLEEATTPGSDERSRGPSNDSDDEDGDIATPGSASLAAAQPRPPRTSSLQGTQPIAREPIDNTDYPLSPSPEDVDEVNVASPPSQTRPQTPPPPPPPVQRAPTGSISTPQRAPAFTRLEDIISSMSEPRVAPRVPQQQTLQSQDRRANQELPVPPRDIVLPRWQPDNEVTFCPICRTQFSIFVRKHHCRKCGRVVCNSCSPHRIVIPYQFIVQPPGQPRRYPPAYGGDDFRSLGGGERVRLCNPCVPDPNTTPPQTQGQGQGSPYSPRSPPGHNRSQSSSNHPGMFQQNAGPLSPLNRGSTLFPSRNRSVTVAGPQSRYQQGPTYGVEYPGHHHQRSRENRILSGTPPTPRSEYLRGSEAEALRHMRQHGASMMDVRGPGRQGSTSSALSSRGMGSSAAGGSGASSSSRYYQIPEEDECPVCHRELPSRNLPDAETLRESHITMCIQAHSQYGSGSGGPSSASVPSDGSSPPLGSPEAGRGGMGIRRATGMFPYKATEKDCVDSAECTICLEEFEVGVPMARLECLCRFHRACIMAWWKNHPGRCPVHQHDGFGF